MFKISFITGSYILITRDNTLNYKNKKYIKHWVKKMKNCFVLKTSFQQLN